MAFDEVAATETFTSVTNENEGDFSTSEVKITTSATDFQTTPGQLNKQPETVATPVGETTMIDVVTEKLLPEEVENTDVTQTRDDSEVTTAEGTTEPITDQTSASSIILEEDTTRNYRPEEGTTRDYVTTQASSTIVMTHTYVMQERKNVSWTETDDISNEIPVEVEMKDDASSKLLDLLTQNFSEADNIIFETEEIAPVKTTDESNTQDPSFLDRIQEERIRDQETENYRRKQ